MDKIEVSQRAREKAWAVRPGCYCEQDRTKWMAGVYDHVRIIQAFARFERDILATRTDATPVAWMPIESAPKDGAWILAKCGDISDERWAHLSSRCFVIRHMGTTDRMGLDMGWGLYPGMGVGDDWFAGWKHLPDATHPPATDVAALVEALQEARRIITEIDDYMKRPERGDWGTECALCMGELLDDDRDALARIDAALAPFTKGQNDE